MDAILWCTRMHLNREDILRLLLRVVDLILKDDELNILPLASYARTIKPVRGGNMDQSYNEVLFAIFFENKK